MAGRFPRMIAGLIAVCGLFVPSMVHGQQTQPLSVSAVAPTRHWSGQAVARWHRYRKLPNIMAPSSRT